ncbi:hypothetical protein Tco_0463131 [Tanacetum coccineum]
MALAGHHGARADGARNASAVVMAQPHQPREVTIKELASDKMGQKEMIHDSVGIVLTMSALPCNKNILSVTRRIVLTNCLSAVGHLELGGGCSWVRVSQETMKNPDFPPSAKPQLVMVKPDCLVRGSCKMFRSLYKCSMELSQSLLMPLYKSLWSGVSGIALDLGNGVCN